MRFSSQRDREVAEKVLNVLQSDKYFEVNYIFQEPFDLSLTPGYYEIVGEPLDLKTISYNLANDQYDENTFWDELSRVFTNASRYHSKKSTKWIADMAKSMLVYMDVERKNAEAGYTESGCDESGYAESGYDGDSNKVLGSSRMPAGLPKETDPLETNLKASSAFASIPDSPINDLPDSTKYPFPKLNHKTKQSQLKKQLEKSRIGSKAQLKSTGLEEETVDFPETTLKTPGLSEMISIAKEPPRKKLKLKLKLGEVNMMSTHNVEQTNAFEKHIESTSIASLLEIELPKYSFTATCSSIGSLPSSERNQLAPQASSENTSAKSSASSPSILNVVLKTPLHSHEKQCCKVLAGLRRRFPESIKWFSSPILDENVLSRYTAVIQNPMDLKTLRSNLCNGKYKSNSDLFCLDLRRIFANSLQFNVSMKESLRPLTIEVLQTVDDLLKFFLRDDFVGPQQAYKPLLYCWKLCIGIINTIYALENKSDEKPLAFHFFHPIKYYHGETPSDFSEKVLKPMDFGTVTANLIEGRYQTVDDFANDCRLIISNCILYYGSRDDGKMIVEQANTLNECLSQQLDHLMQYDRSPEAEFDRMKSKDPIAILKPPPSLLLSIITDLYSVKYAIQKNQCKEARMAPSEPSSDFSTFLNYMKDSHERFDLELIKNRVKEGLYVTAEDFEYDVNAIFRVFSIISAMKNARHAVAMAKFGESIFQKLFKTRIQSFEKSPCFSDALLETRIQQPADQLENTGPSILLAFKLPTEQTKHPIPNISVDTGTDSIRPPSTSLFTSVQSEISVPTDPPLPSQASKAKLTLKQEIPLCFAIVRVKDAYPLIRAVGSLESWEKDCVQFLNVLLKHPWLSSTTPKYIFHAPLPLLFPELCEEYEAKIKHPMDLTTAECNLLCGYKYHGPQDFIREIALVFSNAIQFFEDYRNTGDPLPRSYYDASFHLLRYCRWLSFQLFSVSIGESDETDVTREVHLPLYSWSLTTWHRKVAYDEIETLARKEPESSLKDEIRAWTETECKQLLKNIRQLSGLNYTTFFMPPNFPYSKPSYTSKPISWSKVRRILKKRKYDYIGDFIDDLRLLFRNSLTHKVKNEGSDNHSGSTNDASNCLLSKVELAIYKILLTLVEQIERGRIDKTYAVSDIEAESIGDTNHASLKNQKNSSGDVSSTISNGLSNNTYEKLDDWNGINQQGIGFNNPTLKEEDAQV